MRSQLVKMAFVFALVIAFAAVGSAQSGPKTGDHESGKMKTSGRTALDGGNPILGLAGKVSFVIIKSAAKTAWETTKFAAKDVAKPIIVGVAKPLLLKVAPQITLFALKLTGSSLKKGIPIATKLGMTYLKAKLPI